MRPIIPDINSLVQHISVVNKQPERLSPSVCPHCGNTRLWGHGSYPRKSDKENSSANSLNPISIPRFYCPNCGKTCSSLPECIAPHRHYLWVVQQQVVFLWVLGFSYWHISAVLTPSRWTISRWCRHLKKCFLLHADTLRNQHKEFGRCSTVTDFWLAVLYRFTLSRAMLLLNNAEVTIP